MKKSDKKEGNISIKLKTGLRRGNVTAVAGDVVEVGPGLADRLVERGQAEFVERDTPKPKNKTASKPAKPNADKAPEPSAKPDPAVKPDGDKAPKPGAKPDGS